MDSSLIRSVILSMKPLEQEGQGLSIFNVVQFVLTSAVKKGYIQEAPPLKPETPLTRNVLAVIWELVIEGVFTPGSGLQSPNLPQLRVTDYGRKCFEAGELTAHDPDDYLRRLKIVCPSIDDITLLYVGEALGTFRTGNNLATAAMIGVGAENMLLNLVASVQAALNSEQRQSKFARKTNGRNAKAQHDEVLVRLRSPSTPLPVELASVLTQHIDGIYDLIRRTRNEAGHPTGKRLERFETHALLLLFPTYCKTVHELSEWLSVNAI